MNCEDARALMLEYLEASLTADIIDELREHMEACADCREELNLILNSQKVFEEACFKIEAPVDLMANVRARLIKETAVHRPRKRGLRMVLVLAAALLILAAAVIGADGFENMLKWWRNASIKESESIYQLVQKGYGQKLGLSAEDNGVRVTIDSVVADDRNTVVLIKIEDSVNGYLYSADYKSINVEGSFDLGEYPTEPLGSSFNLLSENDDIGLQAINLAPIEDEEGVIRLNFTELIGIDKANRSKLEDVRLKGSWSFEIPVKKSSSKTYKVDKEIRYDKNLFRIDSITIAPTTTVLSYSYKRKLGTRIEHIGDIKILADGKEYKHRILGSRLSIGQEDGWRHETAEFDSMFFDMPERLEVYLGHYMTFKDNIQYFDIDLSKPFPQTFRYLGSDITIESLGEARVRMTEALKNRKYEKMDFEFLKKDTNDNYPYSGHIDGILIDKKGNKASIEEYHFSDMKHVLEEPRYYTTWHEYMLHPSSRFKEEQIKPERLKILGWYETVFTKDKITIELKEDN